MNSIEKYGLIKCGVCGRRWEEHPFASAGSTCARYRPNVTTAQAVEVARQNGTVQADVKGGIQ